jgi:beta-glucosidase
MSPKAARWIRRGTPLIVIAAVYGSLVCVAATTAFAQPARGARPAFERRVDSLLAELSLADKVMLLGGVDGVSTRAAPSIGLPALQLSDGPVGVSARAPSPAYAAGILLAATWDPALARRVGAAIGADARARGIDILLGPGVNLARDPRNGRNFEYFGEDPWLAGRIAVGYIHGVQSRGVIATVKHYAANNTETNRHTVSAAVDERTLRELYLPAFEAAVREAHVGAVMSAYNRVNGTYATEHRTLNLDILKREWGFDGLLMSDWGATHDGVAAANGGLDLEMPSAQFMTPLTLREAIAQGRVPAAVIDDKVRRLFRVAVRLGAFGRAPVTPVTPYDPPDARAVARDVARAGIVLLKNERNVLPLQRSRVRTISVIGPDAWPAVPTGGGSAAIAPVSATSFLEGIGAAAGAHVRVLYARGLPTALDVMRRTIFDADSGMPGITVERFGTPDWTGSAITTSHVPVADQWVSELWSPRVTHPTSVRWRARYTPRVTGDYLVLVGAGDCDSYTFYVDDRPVITQMEREGQAIQAMKLSLAAGQTITVRLDYVQRSQRIRERWVQCVQ